jgi:hypothetical protein
MPVPDDFSAATLLYLNPELPAFSNVLTVEDAFDRYAAEFSHLHYSIPEPALIGPFAPDVYIAEQRGDIDISSLNSVIGVADSNILSATANPFNDENDLSTAGRFVRSFYRNVHLEREDVFKIIPPTEDQSLCTSGLVSLENLAFTACNLGVGDEVKVLKDGGREIIYGTVEEVLDEHTFKLVHRDDVFPNTEDTEARYVLFGIKVSDPMRVAHINYTRRFHDGFSNEAPTHLLEPFNAELYQTLYPDSRFLTEEEAFVSSRNNWTTNDARITKADDILSSVCPIINDLRVTSNIIITDDAVVSWGDFNLTGVSSNVDAPSADVSRTTLLTEYAAKKYSEIPYDTTAVFNDVIVNGTVTLTNGMDMEDGKLVASNLCVDAISVGDGNLTADSGNVRIDASDLECSCNVVIHQSGFANMLFAGTRIGVGGGGQDAVQDWPSALEELSRGGNQDRRAVNMEVDRKLVLGGGRWQVETASVSVSDDDDANLVVGHATALKHPLLTLGKNAPEGGRGSMTVDGDVFASGTILSLSDEKYKRDVHVIEGALSKVRSLRGCTFHVVDGVETRDDADKGRERSTGLIAQEVARVLPEATHLDPSTGSLCVAYGNLCGLLVEAVKELSDQVAHLTRASNP